MGELLQRLRERKLVQWALAYIAAAFALLQGIDIVANKFNWPDSLERIFILALAVGFFVTLVLAWYHGERGAQRVSGTELVILALLLAVGGGFLWHFAPMSPKATTATSVAATPSAPVTAIPAKSIAVLPFENLSDDKTNAYFASGMQDEILTRLAGIRDLKVISRTSTQQYASHPPNLKIVAEQLGVATVLEGSVQKAENKVRINLQLIDARSDSHLWAQNYDRDVKDIFAVQSDVAERVADALQAQLLPVESARIASVPTQDQQAYDLYLRANAYFHRASDQAALVAAVMPQAIELYQQALAKDTGFALAAAMLSQAHMNMYWAAPDRTDVRLAAAKATADRALALQPGLGPAHLGLALYWYWGHRDYAQALSEVDLARKAMPNSAMVELFAGAIGRREGRWNEAIASFQRAVALDPRSSLCADQLGFVNMSLRRYAQADQAFAHALTVTQDPTDELMSRAYSAVLWKGDLAPLRTAVDSLTPGSNDYAGNALSIYYLRWWSRDYVAAIRLAEAETAANWIDQGNVSLPRRLYLAWALAAVGDDAKARSVYAELRTQTQAALQQRPGDADLHLALGFAAAGLGLKDDAVREGRRATQLIPYSRDNYSGPFYLVWLANLYVRVGENTQAIDTLRQTLALPSGGGAISPALLQLDPAWDPLRKQPDFQALLRESP
ncbi:MAG: hypothetical protein JSR27_09590 [Proteobacteria bacterium]|nr:hypothetical protein [Pseudomonadota bacterium]